jgi:hypothetical protein
MRSDQDSADDHDDSAKNHRRSGLIVPVRIASRSEGISSGNGLGFVRYDTVGCRALG